MSLIRVGQGGPTGGYEVEKSLRFRKSGTASLSRTPSAAGNRKLLAQRFRIKRGELGTLQVLSSAGTARIDRFYFDSSNRLCLDVLGATRLVTTSVFRDPSAWCVDVGFGLDVANGTAASRAKILINGVEATYSTDSRASIRNTDTNWNNTVVHYIGRDIAGNNFDGYLAEPVGVDGSMAVSYSESDGSVRAPVAPSATYGNNGFYLPFNDGTNLTELCRDRSGNGNDWTASGISLTAGATYDWMDDTPTNNFSVLSPLMNGGVALQSGNLRGVPGGAAAVCASIPMRDGQWYFESKYSIGGSISIIGIVRAQYQNQLPSATTSGITSYSWGLGDGPYTSNIRQESGGLVSGAQYNATNGDVLGVAVDTINGEIKYFRNGLLVYTSVGPIGGEWFPMISVYSSIIHDVNFGQRPFIHAPPEGFKPLCTKNLTSDTITTSGSFIGNANGNGPFVWLNGNPESLTINGNAVTWGTHADKIAGGFKVRTFSSSYNAAGTNNYVVTIAGNPFNAPNNAQVNP